MPPQASATVGAETTASPHRGVPETVPLYNGNLTVIRCRTCDDLRPAMSTCVVVGAGVVGLACARSLARSGREVLLLEAEHLICSGTSSRNSEVIHAGIYYEPGSLKARGCTQGRSALYEFCEAYGVPHSRCGKLIVANDEQQLEQLGRIRAKAEANGVDDLVTLSGEEASELEPELRCIGALLSPSTGIIDSHSLALALQGDAEDHGAVIAFGTALEACFVRDTGAGGIHLRAGGAEFECAEVVNAAGLCAPVVASMLLDGQTQVDCIPEPYFAKGNYYRLSGCRSPFSRLVYPVPDPTGAGLGVHATIDLGGQTRFGPDVEWLTLDWHGGRWPNDHEERAALIEEQYEVDPRRADSFYDEVRKYWPGLPDNALEADYSGIRPKLRPVGEPASDFVLQGVDKHGMRGVVNLLGIESPGLTACLALADLVVQELDYS